MLITGETTTGSTTTTGVTTTTTIVVETSSRTVTVITSSKIADKKLQGRLQQYPRKGKVTLGLYPRVKNVACITSDRVKLYVGTAEELGTQPRIAEPPGPTLNL